MPLSDASLEQAALDENATSPQVPASSRNLTEAKIAEATRSFSSPKRVSPGGEIHFVWLRFSITTPDGTVTAKPDTIIRLNHGGASPTITQRPLPSSPGVTPSDRRGTRPVCKSWQS